MIGKSPTRNRNSARPAVRSCGKCPVAGPAPNPGLNPCFEWGWSNAGRSRRIRGIDLGGLVHTPSRIVDAHAAFTEVSLASLDAGDEIRVDLGTVFEVSRQPILKLDGFLARESEDFSFDSFEACSWSKIL